MEKIVALEGGIVRKHGCQSRNHIDCDVENELWECAKCHRKFCYLDGGADDLPDYCDECWHLTHLSEWDGKEIDAGGSKQKIWHKFPIVAKDTAANYTSGIAEFIVADGKGYLWLGDSKDTLLGWIDGKEMDMIARKWLYLRSKEGRKTESARFERLRKWQDEQLQKHLRNSQI
jgi:hypothetical protein